MNNLDSSYQNLLNNILENGTKKEENTLKRILFVVFIS